MTETATHAAPAPTEAIVAFATGGWAMRAPVREAGRRVLIAVLARALAGARSDAVEIALASCEPGTPRLAAHPIGRSERLSAIDAAAINAIAAASEPSPATPVVCAALAAGEGAQAAGAVVLDAIVAGCEIAVRVALALGPDHPNRGWDVDGTCGRIGAAVAATRIFALNAERTRNAIGIAATAAGGLRHAAGTMSARYVSGLAAADGIEAALLARFGFTGAPAAIEGRRGLAALTSAGFAPQLIANALGERFAFLELGDANASEAARTALPQALALAVDRIERLASIDELIAASR